MKSSILWLVVKAHGGEIKAKTDQGEGLLFIIQLLS